MIYFKTSLEVVSLTDEVVLKGTSPCKVYKVDCFGTVCKYISTSITDFKVGDLIASARTCIYDIASDVLILYGINPRVDLQAGVPIIRFLLNGKVVKVPTKLEHTKGKNMPVYTSMFCCNTLSGKRMIPLTGFGSKAFQLRDLEEGYYDLLATMRKSRVGRPELLLIKILNRL